MKKKLFAAVWGLGAAGCLYAWWRSGIPLTDLPRTLRDVVAAAGPWGPVIYLALMLLRCLTFAPASPFVLAAGLLWGPVMGVVWALIGMNLSAWAAYWVARGLGRGWFASHEGPWLHSVEERLRSRPFMASMVLRFIFLPFDVTNFACGLVEIPFLPYAAGTFLGILPGVATFAMFGGAWHDPRALGASAALLVASVLAARLLKKSEPPVRSQLHRTP